jgi:parallel beta-helix repeat protein
MINNTARDTLSGDGFSFGFSIYNTTFLNNTFINNTAYNNSGNGLYIGGPGNTAANNTLQENGNLDLNVYAGTEAECNDIIENNTGSGNRPINYANESVSWSNLDVSELILCNADGSAINNVTIRGSDTLANNQFYDTFADNLLVNNSNSSGNYYGFNMYVVNNFTISNSIAYNNAYYGFNVYSATNFTMTNNSAYNTTQYYGFYLYSATNFTMANNSAYNNAYSGISIGSATNGTFINNTLFNNSIYGFSIDGSTGTNITNMHFYNNGFQQHIHRK